VWSVEHLTPHVFARPATQKAARPRTRRESGAGRFMVGLGSDALLSDFRPASSTIQPTFLIAGTHGLSIDTIELYERNMIDELTPRLVHGSYR
jgi:hypothetical protein